MPELIILHPWRSSAGPIRYYHRRIGHQECGTRKQMSGTDHLDALRRDASSAPVVLFASRITDVREPVARLDELGIDHRIVTMSMGNAASRDRFHVLEEWTGHKTLPQVFLDGRFIGGPTELLAHPRLSGEVSKAGQWLGYAGLIPFVAALLGFVLSSDARQAYFAHQFIAYGAVILAFVGAVHWGVALGGGRMPVMRMSISILPALLAWAALLLPAHAGAWLLLAGFIALRAWEASPPVAGTLPSWYRAVRNHLTAAVALLILLFALAAG
jgi:glutaredoxin